jgi:hypothetical protein
MQMIPGVFSIKEDALLSTVQRDDSKSDALPVSRSSDLTETWVPVGEALRGLGLPKTAENLLSDIRTMSVITEVDGGTSQSFGWNLTRMAFSASYRPTHIIALFITQTPSLPSNYERAPTPKQAAGSVESIVYRRQSAGEQATAGVLFLHGGPHSACTDAFLAPVALLLSENFTVIMPNYRGSSGYGTAHLSALPGKIGSVRSS